MAVKLNIPEIADRPDPAVELRAVYLEEWIETLPLANPAALLRTLLEALGRFNLAPAKPALRLSLLEQYVRPYTFLLEMQEKHGPIRSIAALEKHRADSDATRHVAEALATGYKIVLAQAPSKKLFGQNKESKLALQRASLFLSFALLHSYDEYLPTPSGLWEELTALYLHAGENQLLQGEVAGSGEREEFTRSADTTYKRIVLTSLVDPFHLSYGEIWKVYRSFALHADLASIGALTEQDKPAGKFIIDPDEDQRPAYYAQAKDAADAHCLLLDANAVLEALRKHQAELKEAGRRADHALCGLMVRSLGLPPKRHTPREDSEGRVNLAAGLLSLHHFLGGANGAVDAASADGPGDDLGISLDGDSASAPGTAKVGYTAEFWDLVNQGPGGIGVIKRIRPTNTIGVGEIIGIQFPLRGQSGTNWSVGTVRWLSIGNSGDYHAGVQILAKSATAVSVETMVEGGEPRMTPALAVPTLPAEKGGALITPSGVFNPGSPVTVMGPSGRMSLVPDSLIESTAAFDRFSYRIAGAHS